MNESQYVTKFLQNLRARTDWLAVNHVATPFSRKGIPDVIACYNGRFVGLEFKVLLETGRWSHHYTNHQKVFLTHLNKLGGYGAGVVAYEGGGYALDEKYNGNTDHLVKASIPDVVRAIQSRLT